MKEMPLPNKVGALVSSIDIFTTSSSTDIVYVCPTSSEIVLSHSDLGVGICFDIWLGGCDLK